MIEQRHQRVYGIYYKGICGHIKQQLLLFVQLLVRMDEEDHMPYTIDSNRSLSHLEMQHYHGWLWRRKPRDHQHTIGVIIFVVSLCTRLP